MWKEVLMKTAPDREMAVHVAATLTRLLHEDIYLLEVGANERSISHRLAVYLERQFPDWEVDCEYNRDSHDPKKLRLLDPEPVQSDDDQGKTVYPDIIVHKRGESKNLLAIEIKKDLGENGDKDLRKLCALRHQLGYSYGLFIRFGTGRQAGVTELCWSLD